MPSIQNGNSGLSTSSQRNAEASLPKGIYVPTVAFFTDDDNIDVSTTAQHATRLAQAGVTGIVTHGSNGEAVHLDHEERKLINSTTRAALDAAGRPDMPLIVGCGAQSTRETIQLCREASESGGSYAIVLPPAYYGSLLTTEHILQHFRDVADASPIPILIYNFPGACAGLDLNSDSIITLSQHPNIVGVKLTCGNTGKLARIVASAPESFKTFGGSVDFTIQTLSVGGHGIIGGLANVAPLACVRVMKLWEEGKYEKAQELQKVVARGDWAAIKGGFVAVKVALQTFYGYGGTPRKPCAVLDENSRAEQVEGFSELIETERSLAA